MQDYYDGFSQQMHFAYQEFRQSSYDSVVKARQLNRQGNQRIIAGIGSILAGIYGRTQADSRIAADASTATAAVGGFILKSGLEKKQSLPNMTNQSLKWALHLRQRSSSSNRSRGSYRYSNWHSSSPIYTVAGINGQDLSAGARLSGIHAVG